MKRLVARVLRNTRKQRKTPHNRDTDPDQKLTFSSQSRYWYEEMILQCTLSSLPMRWNRMLDRLSRILPFRDQWAIPIAVQSIL